MRYFRLFLILAAIGMASQASAQTSPNWTLGYVPSPAEWNNMFASKQDYLGNPLTLPSLTMAGPLHLGTNMLDGSNVALTGGTISGADVSGTNSIATGGTASRTTAARAGDIVNVMDFGAKGNGTADDTAAINAAVARIPSTGARLLFPPGNYVVSGSIALPSNTDARGDGAQISAAPATSWTGGTHQGTVFTNVSSATNLTVEGFQFSYAHGDGASHILQFSGATHVVVKNNVSDGGGDFAAMIGDTDTLIDGNRATNVSNSCFDHWGGAHEARVVGNYCSTYASAGPGLGAIQFTGINTDQTAANSTGFICIGNTIFINNANSPQAIVINGHASGGADDKFIVTGNKVFVNNVSAWGVLVTGHANNGIIKGNYLEGGTTTTGTYGAIAVSLPATDVTIEGNVSVNWQAGGQGVYSNSGTGGMVADNEAYSSGQLLGTISSSVMAFGNDTGTGVVNLYNVNIQSGAASFNGAFSSVQGPVWGWNGAGGLVETINSAAGYGRLQFFQTAGVGRWYVGVDNSSESGGNAGSNYEFSPASDAGASLPSALTLARATGTATFGGMVAATASPTVAAAGTTQATATVLASQYSSVMTGTGGVVLTATVGVQQSVFNKTVSAINVYPPAGAAIGSLATNAPASLAPGGSYTGVCVSATDCEIIAIH